MEPNEWIKNKRTVLKNGKILLLEKQAKEEEISFIERMNIFERFEYLLSDLNYFRRKNARSPLDFGTIVKVGDICYIDYGHAYDMEIGYQHFGLILEHCRGKYFVVPITGNDSKIANRCDTEVKDNVMLLGKLQGLKKVSACYLNDAKWISSGRIIDVKGHINADSILFKNIKSRTYNLLESNNKFQNYIYAIHNGLEIKQECENRSEMIELTTLLKQNRVDEIRWFLNGEIYKIFKRKGDDYLIVENERFGDSVANVARKEEFNKRITFNMIYNI